jgi:hypothetical protein
MGAAGPDQTRIPKPGYIARSDRESRPFGYLPLTGSHLSGMTYMCSQRAGSASGASTTEY